MWGTVRNLADRVGAGGRRAALDASFLAILFAVVAAAYWPSLDHPPRADQWWFLIDTRDDHSFLDALKNSYSYNRTRQTAPGDTDLFRPVLFAVLCAERIAFEGHVAPVQALGIGLHCAVCALMLVVIRQIATAVRPPGTTGDGACGVALQYATVTFFALSPCVQELVIWAHLHGYLVFLLLVLGSTSCLLRYAAGVARGAPRAGWLWAGWGLALVSAFTYELGQAYALLTGVLLAALVGGGQGLRRAALLGMFVAILGGYQAVNRIDKEVHKGRYRPENLHRNIVGEAFTRATVGHSARYGVYTAVQPFVPTRVQTLYSAQRLSVAESVWAGRFRKPTLSLMVSAAALIGAAGLGAAGLWCLARERTRTGLLALLIPAGLYVGYAAITVLGRMNMRPDPGHFVSSSYYAYTGLVFALLAASAAWHAVGRRGRYLRAGLAAALFALGAAGAGHVWRVNTGIARHERELVRSIGAVQAFVDAHRDEPGFGFEIDYAASDPIDIPVPEVDGKSGFRGMFGRWMAAPNPPYWIAVRGGKVVPLAGSPGTESP